MYIEYREREIDRFRTTGHTAPGGLTEALYRAPRADSPRLTIIIIIIIIINL